MPSVSDHLNAAATDRNLDWIRSALQSALELECATLPLYQSALFSLEVQNYTAYNLIRSVAMEEMVHMATVCNILAAIGGRPRIKDLKQGFPTHGLPGGAEPDLFAVVAPLSKRQLQNFMRLEMPLFLLPDEFKTETYPAISTLYRAVRTAIENQAEAVGAAFRAGGPANQVPDNIGYGTFDPATLADPIPAFLQAIDAIVEQGEGATSDQLLAGPGSEREESHYCKFSQIYYGASYREPEPPRPLTRETEPDFFRGNPIPWPEVINTLAVPADGYAKILALDPNAPKVSAELQAFDQAYSGILDTLDDVWNGPKASAWPTLGKAVAGMSSLRVKSCFSIIREPIPPDVVARLPELYPCEIEFLRTYTDLGKPMFYGPRFLNLT